ncbi:MAG: MBOAT family O-acyltransferase [Clostridia bacterium]|nr:MBOAT family O-acyltransferase [Clostridia bacterium]
MSPFSLAAAAVAVAFVYYICPARLQWIVLLAASCLLYAQNGAQPLAFLLLTAASTWAASLLIHRIGRRAAQAAHTGGAPLPREEKKRLKARARRRQRAVFFAVLLLNFGILALLKYAHAGTEQTLLRLLGAVGSGGGFRLLVPLGISFYTFQSMGYLIDVYNGKYPPERNPARFLLFVSFFPQMVQGPIGRYDHLAPQLTAPHRPDLKNIRYGLILMLWGFFKKKVIADRALEFVQAVFSDHTPYGGAVIAVSVLLYSLQQYCDFSGGIDLVTGAAEVLGIHLAPNFKRPYFSVSLGDFWRRWHISLGAWMRDYVFYPFALTRPMRLLSKALKKTAGAEIARAMPAALGNILVFLLVGVWHGASMNYVLWGLYNGVILAVSALMEPAYKRFGETHAALVKSRGFHILRVLRTFLIVNIGWYFDRCADFRDALAMLGKTVFSPRLWQLTDGTLFSLGLTLKGFSLLGASAALLFAVSLAQERGIRVRPWLDSLRLPARWALLYGLILVSILFSVSGSGFSSGFIYAMF